MFGAEYALADVLVDFNTLITTTGVAPVILAGVVAGVAGLIIRMVKRSSK